MIHILCIFSIVLSIAFNQEIVAADFGSADYEPVSGEDLEFWPEEDAGPCSEQLPVCKVGESHALLPLVCNFFVAPNTMSQNLRSFFGPDLAKKIEVFYLRPLAHRSEVILVCAWSDCIHVFRKLLDGASLRRIFNPRGEIQEPQIALDFAAAAPFGLQGPQREWELIAIGADAHGFKHAVLNTINLNAPPPEPTLRLRLASYRSEVTLRKKSRAYPLL